MVLKEIVASNDFFSVWIFLRCSYPKLHFLSRILLAFTADTQETCTKPQMGIPGIGSLAQ